MDTPTAVYCSWCLQSLPESATASSKLDCPNCERGLRRCAAIGCQHYACWGQAVLGERRRRQRHLYCAEHRHAVANFDGLTAALSGPDQFREVYAHRSRNLSRATRLGLITLGGAVIAGPIAAIARFGLGVGSGAVLGGIAGAYVGNAYLGDIEGFDIRQIKAGKSPAVITINGFLSHADEELADWSALLTPAYGEHRWYHLDWEARNLSKLGRYLVSNFAGELSTNVAKSAVAAMTGSVSAKIQTGLLKRLPVGKASGAVAGIASAIANPWHVTLARADQTGVLLADIIRRCPEQKFILCGHSLGARVILVALETLATAGHQEQGGRVESVQLFAAAADNDPKRWQHAAKAVQGNIYNFHSDQDKVLRYLYSAGTGLRSKPAGRHPIEECDKVINQDVSAQAAGHMQAKSAALAAYIGSA